MSDYLDEELAARGRRRLERHVQDCAECRGVLRGLQRMLGKLHDMAAPAGRPAPRDLAARVRERLTAQRHEG
jgi:predicted anti-sigma-YlaC factor YlaD